MQAFDGLFGNLQFVTPRMNQVQRAAITPHFLLVTVFQRRLAEKDRPDAFLFNLHSLDPVRRNRVSQLTRARATPLVSGATAL